MILTIEQVEAVLQAIVDGEHRQDAAAILSHILHKDATAARTAAADVELARIAALHAPPSEQAQASRGFTAAIEYHAADRRARKLERRAAALSATAAHERQTAALMRGKP